MASTARSEAPSPATCQTNFEQGVAFAMHLWPALTLAVQNHWGGTDSEDKRDWFVGAIVDLFPDLSKVGQSATTTNGATAASQTSQDATTTTDEEPEQFDIESVLVQVMQDEFEVSVDDDSAFETAEQIMRMRAEVIRGKFDEVGQLRRRWEARKGAKVAAIFAKGEDRDDDTDWDTDDDGEEGEDGDGDVEMGDASPPPRRERQAPQVDEDGFTTITRKKR